MFGAIYDGELIAYWPVLDKKLDTNKVALTTKIEINHESQKISMVVLAGTYGIALLSFQVELSFSVFFGATSPLRTSKWKDFERGFKN